MRLITQGPKLNRAGKTNYIFLLIIFVVAAAVGILVCWMSMPCGNIQETEIVDTNQNQNTELDTSDWQTYTNEEYGFEIKYPSQYIVQDTIVTQLSDQEIQELSGASCYGDFFEATKSLRKLINVEISPSDEIKSSGINVYVRVYNNLNNLTLNKWLDVWDDWYSTKTACDLKGTENILHRKDFSINMLNGIQGIGGCCGGCEKEIFFSKNDKIYNISLLGGSPCDDYGDCSVCIFSNNTGTELLFDQMLSTFRFLDGEEANYNIFGKSKFDVTVKGYLEIKEAEVSPEQYENSEMDPIEGSGASFVITECYDKSFEDYINNLALERKEINLDGKYRVYLGAFEDGKIMGIKWADDGTGSSKPEAYIDEAVLEKLLESSKENLISVILSFGVYDIDWGCGKYCNYVKRVKIYNETL